MLNSTFNFQKIFPLLLSLIIAQIKTRLAANKIASGALYGYKNLLNIAKESLSSREISQYFDYENREFFDKAAIILNCLFGIKKKDFFVSVQGKPDNFDEIIALLEEWDCLGNEKFIPIDFYLENKGIVYFFLEYRNKIVSEASFNRGYYDSCFQKILARHDWKAFLGSKVFVDFDGTDNYQLTETGKAFHSVLSAVQTKNEAYLIFIIDSIDFILKEFDKIVIDYCADYCLLLVEKFIKPLIDDVAEIVAEVDYRIQPWRNLQYNWQDLLKKQKQEELLIKESQHQEDGQDSESESDSVSDQEYGEQNEVRFLPQNEQILTFQPTVNRPVSLSPAFHHPLRSNYFHRSPYAYSNSQQPKKFDLRTQSGKILSRYHCYHQPNSYPSLFANKNYGVDYQAEVAVSQAQRGISQLQGQPSSSNNFQFFNQPVDSETADVPLSGVQFASSVGNCKY